MVDGAENKVTFKVDGMIFGHCVDRVRKALDAATGVTEAKVDLESGSAEVRFGAAADIAKLSEVVSEAGHPARAA